MRPGLFDDRSAIRDIGSEPYTILGGGTALLLQQARAVMHPDLLRVLLCPVMLVFRIVTAGLLPEPVREQYGLPWTPARRRMFVLIMTLTRTGTRPVPAPLLKLPVELGVPFARRFRWGEYQRPASRRSAPVLKVETGAGEVPVAELWEAG